MFKFFAQDYYEHCHCINVVNLLQYMDDNESVEKLVPFLQKEKFYEHVESCVNSNDPNIDAVRYILDVHCGYTT